MSKYIVFALSLALLASLWMIDHIGASLEASSQRVRTLESSERSRKETIRLLAKLDTEHTKERERANQTNANLRADIAAGKLRLSVLATNCTAVRTTSTTTGMGDAEARAELDPAAAERIVRVANDGDDAIRALTGLQDWVRTACPAK
ncbi:lysis protein [Pseudomonas donghuensis]|uniref:lysis protein n=1 Tax=Pseudomonas donghuensis TaxID=1163398 RepID=UPI00215FC5D7|nr:lysis protein [Pseudomonas donghuensis]UVL22401.1 lysis protein [Pseudomonas donghuensis]